MKKLLALVAFSFASVCCAQTYPSKPIRLVVPFPPGGSNDIVARMLATQLAGPLGQSVVIENKGGAGGVLGTDGVAKAAPDGYTLLLISVAYAFAPALYKTLPYDPATAFAPITIVGRGPSALTVHPSVPANTVAELIALAKKNPGKLNYASAGVGSFQHLSAALFMVQAGIDVVHIPYKGGGPAMADVMGGQAQIVMPSLIQVVPHIKSGRLKALGTSGARRSPQLPDVPAIAETLPGYESQNWWGVLAPAGTPQPVLERLYGAMTEVLQSKETGKRMESEGAETVRMTPAEFGRFISAELAKWGKVARDVGIQAE
ncbi:MAG TPA: tripartite tricarboxylate transporter substrate binding protein [Burkholderiales bacterium]|nr:tripartite tricarboxylate transporter substrate binding protein [Burkholderiales bacterium]